MPEADVSIATRARGLSRQLIPILLGGSLAVALVTPKGFGVLLGLALLAALFSLRFQKLAKLRSQDRLFLILLNIYPLLVLTSMFIHGQTDFGLSDNASRFLLLSAVYLALRSRPFYLSYIVIGAMVGCGLTFVAALVHLVTDSGGPHGGRGHFVVFENAIVFAQIAFFLLLVASTPVRLPQLSESGVRLLLAALLLMASASLVIAESRGVLLALLLLYGYLLFFDHRLARGLITKLALLLAGLGLGMYLLTTPYLSHLGGTASELAANYQEIDQQTSLGQRLTQWSLSRDLIAREPVTGYGIGQFKAAIASLPEAATLSEKVRDYGHPHNEFLALAVEQGLPALIIFVTAILAIPVLAWRETFVAQARYLLYGAVCFWMLFGLTQTQLAHQKTTMMFALLLLLGFSHGMNLKYGALGDDGVEAPGVDP